MTERHRSLIAALPRSIISLDLRATFLLESESELSGGYNLAFAKPAEMKFCLEIVSSLQAWQDEVIHGISATDFRRRYSTILR